MGLGPVCTWGGLLDIGGLKFLPKLTCVSVVIAGTSWLVVGGV